MGANVAELLADLQRRGIELRADGDRLRFRPAAAVDDRLRAVLARNKADILAALARAEDVDCGWELTPDDCLPQSAWAGADRAAVEAGRAPAGPGYTFPPSMWPSFGNNAALPARTVNGHDVPAGWTVAAWRDRLRQLAGVCMNPTRAAELRDEADGLAATTT